MKNKRFLSGFSLIEILVVTGLSAVVMIMVLRGVLYLQKILAQQMRLERLSQVLLVTQDISQNVRSAKRILSVGADHLELETFNYSTFGLLDSRLYEQTKRIRYQVKKEEGASVLVREVYASTSAMTPERFTLFLNKVQLLEPTDANPFFTASYIVGTSTVGVRVELGLHPPFSKDEWVPVKNEVYVQAE